MLVGCARALQRPPPGPWGAARVGAVGGGASTATTTTYIRRRRRRLEEDGGQACLPLSMAPPLQLLQCRSKHTSQWVRRHVRDPYVRAAKKDDLRSRAAFKLKEMQAKAPIIRPGDCVIDLGCAPGGWSEVAVALVKVPAGGGSSSINKPPSQSQQQQPQQQAQTQQQGRRRPRQGRVIGIDLLPVTPPVPGATLLQGDFTDPAQRAELLRLATAPDGEEESGGGTRPVNVVLSDLAPNFSGDAHTDHVRTLQLCYEVFGFAAEAFAPSFSGAAAARRGRGGGTVLCKFFKGRDEPAFLAHVKASYAEVKLLKPKASRSESSETYVLARGFCRSSNTEGEEEAPGGGGGGAGGRDA